MEKRILNSASRQYHQQLKDEPLAYSKLQNTKVRQPLRQAQKCSGWV